MPISRPFLTLVGNRTRRKKRKVHHAISAEVLEPRAMLATLTVNSLEDTIVDDEFLTLREALALQQRAEYPGHDTIEFDPSLFGGTIQLGLRDFRLVDEPLTIAGPGSDLLTIDGSGGQIFTIQNRHPVEIRGLKLTGAASTSSAAVISHEGNVPLTLTDLFITENSSERLLIASQNLTIVDSRVTHNSVTFGAAIGGGGQLTIMRTDFSNNVSEFNVSAVQWHGSVATISDSTISNNSGTSAVRVDGGSMTITNCTLNANTGVLGGAIFNQGNLKISNSTISGNSATRNGGGIFNVNSMEVVGSTIVGNRSGSTGGLFGGGGIATTGIFGSTLLNNTIVAGNLRGTGTIANEFGGRSVDGNSSNNLVGDQNTSRGLVNGENGNIVGVSVNSVLDTTLRDNGGPTLTHALLPDSPAIDAGNNGLIPAGVTTDQRGQARIVNEVVDIGSFELRTVIPNLPPVANDDPSPANTALYTTSESSALAVDEMFGLLANDSDPEGRMLELIAWTTPSVGLLNVNPDGSFEYDPDGEFESLALGELGTASFTYTIADPAGVTDSTTATVVIVGENDIPTVSGPVVATTDEDGRPQIVVGLLNGAADVDASDILNATSLVHTGGNNAGIIVSGNELQVDKREYQYLDDGEQEVITFSFEVNDGNGGVVPQTATIIVEGRNDAPSGADFALTGTEDSPLALSAAVFEANFSDRDANDSLVAVRIDTLPANGTLALDGTTVTSGQVIGVNDLDFLVFHPDLNFNGETIFEYSPGDGTEFAPSTSSISLNLLSARMQAAILVEKVKSLSNFGNPDNPLNNGQVNALTSILGVKRLVEPDSGKVNAFLNHVHGLILGGVLTDEEARELIDCGSLLLISLETN